MPSMTVGTTPEEPLPRNSKRLTFTVRNESTASQKIFISLRGKQGLTTTNADYVLRVAEEKSFIRLFDGPNVKNPIGAVASDAGATLYYAETNEHGGE